MCIRDMFKIVVDDVADPDTEIDIEKARELDPSVQLDDEIGFPLKVTDLGRIAAQSAKQVIIQRMRDAEQELIYEEFKDRVGEICSGIIQRRDKGGWIINLGRTEAILPKEEQIPREHYKRGDRVQALIIEVKKEGRGPQIVISRSHRDYTAALFRREVPEVDDGKMCIRDRLNMVRVISGTISSESTLKNMRTEESERLGTLLYLDGKTQTPCKDVLGPGAIIAVGKLKNTRTGDTLSDDKAPFAVAMPQLAPQLITFALAPKEKGDEDKVYAAVQKLLDEDVTLKLSRDEESGDILLSGMGQLHIETAVERAKRRYKVEILLKTPKVPYRETVRGKVQVQGRHKKQSGGRGQFGDCWIEMEGLPRGSGYVFEDAIVGGAIPRNYIPAIDKGVQESRCV